MPRTVNNTGTLEPVPAAATTAMSAWSSTGLSFSTGYESHSLYPVKYQVLTIGTLEDGGQTKRVWLRGAIRKSDSSNATDFEGEVLVLGLPESLQPAANHTYVVPVYDAGGTDGNRRKELHLAVTDSGKLVVWGADAETISSTAGSSLTLDGICWDTAV
jgi:hypothetical protein